MRCVVYIPPESRERETRRQTRLSRILERARCTDPNPHLFAQNRRLVILPFSEDAPGRELREELTAQRTAKLDEAKYEEASNRGFDLEFRWCLRVVETVSGEDDGACSGEPRDLRESLELSKVRIRLETYRSSREGNANRYCELGAGTWSTRPTTPSRCDGSFASSSSRPPSKPG